MKPIFSKLFRQRNTDFRAQIFRHLIGRLFVSKMTINATFSTHNWNKLIFSYHDPAVSKSIRSSRILKSSLFHKSARTIDFAFSSSNTLKMLNKNLLILTNQIDNEAIILHKVEEIVFSKNHIKMFYEMFLKMAC